MTFYHFTAAEHLEAIFNSEHLRPSSAMLNFYPEPDEPQVVWLLDTLTVSYPHGLVMPNAAPNVPDKTAVRIAVDVPAIKWTDWEPAVSRMPRWWRDAVVSAAGGPEAADHWYVWPGLIAQNRWEHVAVLPDALAGLPPEVRDALRPLTGEVSP